MNKLSPSISHYLNESVLTKLEKRKITTSKTFLSVDSELIAQISGLHFRHVLKIKELIVEKTSSKIRTGYNLYHDVCKYGALLPTGISSLDRLLDGGFMTGHIYEICGQSASGKSQLCMMVAAYLCGKLSQNVFYIDTKRDFSAHRVASFLTPITNDVGGCLNKIAVARPKNAYELLSCLHSYINQLNTHRESIKLFIIDSLIKCFYEHSDNKEHFGLLSNVASVLQYMAAELHIAVIVTNVMTQWQGKDAIGLGSFWYGIPQTRLILKGKVENSKFYCTYTIDKSTSFSKGKSAQVEITNNAIM